MVLNQVVSAQVQLSKHKSHRPLLLNAKNWVIPAQYVDYRYSLAAHGVGMADERSVISLNVDFDETAMSGVIETGMVLCIESLVGEAGSESVKLETQVLVTDTGYERLDSFPWEEV